MNPQEKSVVHESNPQNKYQSPNWDKYQDLPKNTFVEEGFPFHEGWPPERGPSGRLNDKYELISRNGTRYIGLVDYSCQYRAEGIEWRTLEGEVVDKGVVVAWKLKEEIVQE